MKTLRLSVRLEPNVSVAELANLFGDYFTFKTNISENRYIQFEFKHIRMLTSNAIRGIARLLEGYEAKKPLTFKMFHLFDDERQQTAPVHIPCYNGTWVVTTTEGAELNRSKNLLTLI